MRRQKRNCGRTSVLKLRVTPELKELAGDKAAAEGITLSRWIVRQIRRGVERAGSES